MDRRIALLHSTIVPSAEQVPVLIKQRRTDRYATFGEADFCFFDRYAEH